LPGELFKSADDLGEGRLDIRNRAFGIVGPLPLQTALVFEKFFPVELCDRVLRADWPRIGNEAWHAGP